MRICSILIFLGLTACADTEKALLEETTEDCRTEDCSDQEQSEDRETEDCEALLEECIEDGGSREECGHLYEECNEEQDDRSLVVYMYRKILLNDHHLMVKFQ